MVLIGISALMLLLWSVGLTLQILMVGQDRKQQHLFHRAVHRMAIGSLQYGVLVV